MVIIMVVTIIEQSLIESTTISELSIQLIVLQFILYGSHRITEIWLSIIMAPLPFLSLRRIVIILQITIVVDHDQYHNGSIKNE